MSGLLAGKVAVVTGSSSGIGRAIAVECARQGAKLVLHHLGDAQARKDVEEVKAEIEQVAGRRPDAVGETVSAVDVGVDVTSPEAGERIVSTALEAFGQINILVQNAGIAQFAPYLSVTRPQMATHMAVNFTGPFHLSQAVVAQMLAQGTGGAIVSIASVSATSGSSQLAHYAATKAAVLGLTASAAVALGRDGIRFNCVSPGTVETAMNREDLQGAKGGEMKARVPLGRLGVPEDIAGPVVFLSSDMARYVTGQNVVVDGGASLNYQ